MRRNARPKEKRSVRNTYNICKKYFVKEEEELQMLKAKQEQRKLEREKEGLS